MSQPTISSVHVNRPLTNIAVAFAQDPANFVSMQAFPRVPVRNMSDSFFTFDRAHFLRSQAQFRAAGAVAMRSGYDVSTSTYKCQRQAIGHAIPDPVRRNADAPLDLDAKAAEFVAAQLLLAVEVNWATSFFGASIWTGSSSGGDITPGTTWENAASTPIEDIRTQQRAMHTNTGYSGNVLVFGMKVFDNLLDHPDVIDRIKYTAGAGNPAQGSREILARLFGVEKVLVAKATRNTGEEADPAAYSLINGTRNAMLVHAPASPSINEPSAGYTFVWDGDGAGNDMGMSVKRYRDEPVESDIIEGGIWYDHVVTSAALGVFFSNAVAA